MPPTARRRRRRADMALAVSMSLTLLVACSAGDPDNKEPTSMSTTVLPATDSTPDAPPATESVVAVNGTQLAVHREGRGDPVLLVHGGGEDASTLAAQATSLADAGFEAITYDRRGTGRSGRDDWPGNGAAQHADDAAALIDELGLGPAVVVGVSSGGVVALDLAARHPRHVVQVIAWEPPAAGVLADGPAITAQIMAPVEAHLAANPGDFIGAQALLLSALVGFPVAVDDPAFAETRVHAEPMVRDDPTITLQPFGPDDVSGADVTLAIGSAPNDLIAAAVDQLADWTGRPPVQVEGEHEGYVTDPSVLTDLVRQQLAAR